MHKPFSYDFGTLSPGGSPTGWGNPAASHIVSGGYNGMFSSFFSISIEIEDNTYKLIGKVHFPMLLFISFIPLR